MINLFFVFLLSKAFSVVLYEHKYFLVPIFPPHKMCLVPLTLSFFFIFLIEFSTVYMVEIQCLVLSQLCFIYDFTIAMAFSLFFRLGVEHNLQCSHLPLLSFYFSSPLAEFAQSIRWAPFYM